MSVRLLLEGPDLQALLAEVRRDYGQTFTIVKAERVRSGGVGGFFAKQCFELTIDIPAPGQAPTPRAQVPDPAIDVQSWARAAAVRAQNDQAAASAQNPVNRVEDAINALPPKAVDTLVRLYEAQYPDLHEDHAPPAPAAELPRAEEAAVQAAPPQVVTPESDAQEAEASSRSGWRRALSRVTLVRTQPQRPAGIEMANSEQCSRVMSLLDRQIPVVEDRPAPVVISDPVTVADPVTGDPEAVVRPESVHAESAVDLDEPISAVDPFIADGAERQEDLERLAVAQETVVLRPEIDRAVSVEPKASVEPAIPTKSLREISDEDRFWHDRIPGVMRESLLEMGRSMAQTIDETAATAAFSVPASPAEIQATTMPHKSGQVLVVVGELREVQPIVDSLVAEAPFRTQLAAVLSTEVSAAPSGSVRCLRDLSDVRNLGERLAIAAVPSVVIVDAPISVLGDPVRAAWVREAVVATGPTRIWGSVDATRQASLVEQWVRAVGGVEAVATHNVEMAGGQSIAPELGLPEVFRDGVAVVNPYGSAFSEEARLIDDLFLRLGVDQYSIDQHGVDQYSVDHLGGDTSAGGSVEGFETQGAAPASADSLDA